MDKGKIDKTSGSMNIFEVKPIKRDFGYKITAADVFNEFLYVGDDKGNVYSYPIRPGQSQIIAKTTNEQVKNITKHKIDKIQSFPILSSIIVLSDQKIFVVDSGMRKVQNIAQKVHDFAVNQVSKQGSIISIAIVSKKKQGYIVFLNNQTKKFQQSKKFNFNQLPLTVGHNGTHIICSYKKQYQTYNIEKNFAMAKGPLQTRNPFFKINGQNDIVFFMDDVGLFMDPNFMPLQRDNITLNNQKPLINTQLCGKYCLILCQGSLQVYSIFDPKKCVFVQEMNISINIRGITSSRPFIYGRDELMYLYQIPYQIQIKSLLERCKVQQALALLYQNVGPDNEQKIQQLKMNAIWPLLRKMQFDKAKDILKSIQFDIRQLVLLFPQLSISSDIQSIKGIKPQKFMNTLIMQFLGQKVGKSKDQESDLKKRSKLFLKQILQFKRQYYLSKTNLYKMKVQFNTSKNSLIKQKLNPATPEQLLQIIDFYLISLLLNIQAYTLLEKFFKQNQVIYCKRLFVVFQTLIRSNQNLISYATLKPRFYAVFDRLDDAFESWKFVAENSKQQAQKTSAYQQLVKLLTQFEDKKQVYKRLLWILKKRPQIGMGFFRMIDVNFIQPQDVIKNFEQQNNQKYLQLYLQIIVLQKKTQIQLYHTKLLMLYFELIFKISPKQLKQPNKTPQFIERVNKMRNYLMNAEAKYASQPVLKKIQKCQWLLDEQVYLYSRQKRHQEALKKYIYKDMKKQAEEYCRKNRDGTLTIYFKLLLGMYRSLQSTNNKAHLFWRKDTIAFLKKYASQPELDPITVLEMIPDNWLLSDDDGGGIYPFLQSAIIHTLHEKRSTYTSKYLSQMDLLNVQYSLIQAKKAYLRFTHKKKCAICDAPISDKFFVVYPNANVIHQACVKKQKNTVCPITKQDFQKTFKY